MRVFGETVAVEIVLFTAPLKLPPPGPTLSVNRFFNATVCPPSPVTE